MMKNYQVLGRNVAREKGRFESLASFFVWQQEINGVREDSTMLSGSATLSQQEALLMRLGPDFVNRA